MYMLHDALVYNDAVAQFVLFFVASSVYIHPIQVSYENTDSLACLHSGEHGNPPWQHDALLLSGQGLQLMRCCFVCLVVTASAQDMEFILQIARPGSIHDVCFR